MAASELRCGLRWGTCPALLASLWLCACATVDINRAQVLAKAGDTASASLNSAAGQVVQSFQDERREEDLQDALIGAPQEPPGPEYAQVLDKLQARAHVASTLTDSYAAFAALAAYDSSGQFQQAAGGFFDAVNAVGQKAGASQRVDEAILTQVGGQLMALDQARRLKKASAALRQALITYKAILEHDSPAFVSVERHAVVAHYQAVETMWSRGLLEGTQLVASLETEDGLSLTSQDYTAKSPVADALVKYELHRRRDKALAAIVAADEANRQLVGKLIDKHAAFEAGGALSLSDLQTIVDQLGAAAGAISKAKKGA